MDAENTKSEFGKGLTYCLGLFLCHSERNIKRGLEESINKELNIDLWFNASSDHFYELEIPSNLSQNLQERLTILKEKCLTWGHGFQIVPTKEDKVWAIKEAKELLRLIDEHFGISTAKATWD